MRYLIMNTSVECEQTDALDKIVHCEVDRREVNHLHLRACRHTAGALCFYSTLTHCLKFSTKPNIYNREDQNIFLTKVRQIGEKGYSKGTNILSMNERI